MPETMPVRALEGTASGLWGGVRYPCSGGTVSEAPGWHSVEVKDKQ